MINIYCDNFLNSEIRNVDVRKESEFYARWRTEGIRDSYKPVSFEI